MSSIRNRRTSRRHWQQQEGEQQEEQRRSRSGTVLMVMRTVSDNDLCPSWPAPAALPLSAAFCPYPRPASLALMNSPRLRLVFDSLPMSLSLPHTLGSCNLVSRLIRHLTLTTILLPYSLFPYSGLDSLTFSLSSLILISSPLPQSYLSYPTPLP